MSDSDKAVASNAEAGNYAAYDDAKAVLAVVANLRSSSLEVETSRACGDVRGMQLLLLLSGCWALTPSKLLRAAVGWGSSPAAGQLCRCGKVQ